jgi:hypothetical protein
MGDRVEAKSMNREAYYRRQIGLCEQLLDCMIRERELNVDRLWSIAEEKQHILRSFEGVQSQFERDQAMGPKEDPSPAGQRVAGKLSFKLEQLKQDIRRRVTENVQFVGETLGFFDELVSLLAVGAQGPDSYPAAGRARKGALPLIYSKEV